jgi:tetraacyldisaccharide 4'-kinase
MDRKKRKELIRHWVARLLPPVATLLIRLLSLTLRYRIHVAEETREIFRNGNPVIFAFWHGRMIIMPPVYHKVCGKEGKDAWIMVSRHWDGELIARTVEPFRILSARGSTTRGGREALQELIEKARQGHTIGITPDGPRGPRCTVQPGVVRIAQLTGTPIIPLTWAARPRWVASSWDHYTVPLPFARVSVVFDRPFHVPECESANEFESCRARLEQRLGEVTDRMEAEVKVAAEQGWTHRLWVCGRGMVSRLGGSIRTALQQFWAPSSPRGMGRSLLVALLSPPSHLYSLALRLRRVLYRKGVLETRRAGLPVVSIGGVRVGGSGKTPFAMWMARRLTERGLRVVLLTRGYGRRRKEDTLLLTGKGLENQDPLDCGDEPYLLANNLPDVPVAVDGDRYRATTLAEKWLSPDLFLMDDGFQHIRLARDYDIVLVPGDEDLSRTACLPAGPLREPLSALKEADVVVCISSPGVNRAIGKESDQPWCKALEADVPVHLARLAPNGLHRLEDQNEVDMRELAESRVGAFCGIARPETFWRTLEEMGLHVAERIDFPDHHPYSGEDHRDLLRRLSDLDRLVTTEKDAVKLRQYRWPEGKVLFLRLDLIMDEESGFWERLETSGVLTKRGVHPGEAGA